MVKFAVDRVLSGTMSVSECVVPEIVSNPTSKLVDDDFTLHFGVSTDEVLAEACHYHVVNRNVLPGLDALMHLVTVNEKTCRGDEANFSNFEIRRLLCNFRFFRLER